MSWKTEDYPVEEKKLAEFNQRASAGEALKIEYESGTLSSGGVRGCDIGDCRKLRDKLISQLRKTTEQRYGKQNVLHTGCTSMKWRVKKWQFDPPDNRRKCESRVSLTVYAVAKV